LLSAPRLGSKNRARHQKILVANDFSEKQVACFITLGGDKSEKTLENMKAAVNSKLLVGELAISNALENQKVTEQKVGRLV